ncbi:protein [Escherichia coli]|uniref:Protein n=1 Tax=Escherichia coli TaxID=562 RepID=A0A376TFU1_ECOLX|nr:protein [Escherichia coli]
MSQPLNADQELVSDVVACQLVIKQILDVLDVIAPRLKFVKKCPVS